MSYGQEKTGMNWEAVGAIAEAIGVLAIFVSLVYVAAQIRQSTHQLSLNVEATQLAAFERNVDSGNRVRELLILHPDLAQLLLKGFNSYRELEVSEQFRFGMLLRNIFSEMQGAYIRQLSVSHDPLDFEGSARFLDEFLINRGVREWLETTTPDWHLAFRKFVDGRLASIKQQPEESAI